MTWIQASTLKELLDLKAQHPEAKLVVGNTEIGKGLGQLWVSLSSSAPCGSVCPTLPSFPHFIGGGDSAPSKGLPWWLRQERICLQCGRPRFDPWVGKIPWRREWLPTPIFLLLEFHGQRCLVGHSPWGHQELDTIERLTLTFQGLL